MKKHKNYQVLLWLDDYRDPFDTEVDWLVFSPIGRDVKVAWVKSYEEFVEWIEFHGLPDGICFDHDLGTDPKGVNIEKTGKDCANWLINYCIDNGEKLPRWNAQSANSVGRENINKILGNFLKFQANDDNL